MISKPRVLFAKSSCFGIPHWRVEYGKVVAATFYRWDAAIEFALALRWRPERWRA